MAPVVKKNFSCRQSSTGAKGGQKRYPFVLILLVEVPHILFCCMFVRKCVPVVVSILRTTDEPARDHWNNNNTHNTHNTHDNHNNHNNHNPYHKSPSWFTVQNHSSRSTILPMIHRRYNDHQKIPIFLRSMSVTPKNH
jgi:hypothetical protein